MKIGSVIGTAITDIIKAVAKFIFRKQDCQDQIDEAMDNKKDHENKPTRRFKLDIDQASNPQFFSMLDKHNSLMAEWNDFNKALHDLEQPNMLLFGHKKKIVVVGKKIQALQGRFLEWNREASEILKKPQFVFDSSEINQTKFLHYTAIVRHLLTEMNHNMAVLTENYNKKFDSHSSQVNFIIAIISFVVTFAGLIATLLTIT